jgi:hypothetical protein
VASAMLFMTSDFDGAFLAAVAVFAIVVHPPCGFA